MPTYTRNISSTDKHPSKNRPYDYLFFWSNSQGNPSVHWTKKEHCQQSLAQGGLGTRDLAKWNYALLMRQAWQIHSNPHLLIVKIYRGKCGTHSCVDIAYYSSRKHNASWGHRPMYALFNESKTGWDIGKLRSLVPHNVEPLSNNREYNVKSGYG
ncbi:hypothetical protein Cgig2_030097 [Carnegiea gigantea]|uniref:Uncharacterized protein n=1 Tax=Carnegiea gigantea TaxID=171969 RepID=A0A9Q1JLB0_9CARY|nr:hypothetical protein Cgig2_030097 [Carnegiea gigantea]